MTGTPSRTATALDGGVTPATPTESYATLVRPVAARERGEEAVSKALARGTRNAGRRPYGGRMRSVAGSPMSSGLAVVDATGGWGEGHASYPGRSVCLPTAREGHGLAKSKDERWTGRSQQRPK